MTRISDMTPLVVASPTGIFVPVEKTGSPLNYRVDLAAMSTVSPQMFYQASDADYHSSVAASLSYLTASPLSGYGYGHGTASMFIPASPSLYEMGATPIDMADGTTRVEGEGSGDAGGWSSALHWSANSHGFRLQFSGTSGDTTSGGANIGATGSTISGLALAGAYNGTTVVEGNYHGVFMRTRASLRDLNIWNWQGDGVHIHAGVGLPEYGNASNWEIRRAWIQNTTNGVFTDASDTNQGICYGVQVSNARAWGFSDSSGIGNLYVAPLTQLCGATSGDGTTAASPVCAVHTNGHHHAVKVGREVQASTNAPPVTATDDANWLYFENGGAVTPGYPDWFSGIHLRAGGSYRLANSGTIVHGYAEGNQPPAQLGSAVLVLGGAWGGRLPVGGGYINAGGDQVLISSIRVIGDQKGNGGLNIDNDTAGAVSIGRYSSGAGCAILAPTSICSYLAINSPDNTQMLQVANTGVTVAGAAKSSHATAGVGYATGAGGAVTQATSRTTGVTLNKTCGAITLFSAAGTATWQTFTVTNSAVAATDVVRVVQKNGTDKNMIHVTAVGAGSFDITFATTGGTTTEQPVFNFAVIKAVAA